jgi:glycosyltransferase involved in cell wall biosynthesis
MKLLIITQVIDTQHPVLGFFHRWVEEFAQHCEHVHVIALQVGEYSLPENVTVHSLGKEDKKGRLTYLYRFYKLIWQLRHEYENVFVHMNQIYVILGAPLWKVLGKRIGLWYVHKQVTVSLRLAVLLVHHIFSSVQQSMQIDTKKVLFVGHGIDLERFNVETQQSTDNVLRIIHIGRITKIKNIDVLLEAVALLMPKHNLQVSLYGDTVNDIDKKYKSKLEKYIISHNLTDIVHFCGSVPHDQIPDVLSRHDLSINLTPTGGMDKAVIESATVGVPVITTNQSYKKFLAHRSDYFLATYNNSNHLARSIDYVASLSKVEYKKLSADFKNFSSPFSIVILIRKIITTMNL